MILETILQTAVEIVAYPILYVIGFAAIKVGSFGRARILPLTERGDEKEMRWHQLFVYRSGVRFWTCESVMLVGMVVGVALGFITWLILRRF